MYLTTIIRVGALMFLGTDVSGHNHVWAQINCVWAQSCMGTIVSGHKRGGTIPKNDEKKNLVRKELMTYLMVNFHKCDEQQSK